VKKNRLKFKKNIPVRFWFYKPKTEKTEPNPNRKKPEKKPSQTGKKPSQTGFCPKKPNRTEPKPVGLNQFRFFLKKIRFDYFFLK
jgi:hypothetical protein